MSLVFNILGSVESMIDHEERVREIIQTLTSEGRLKSRESTTVEFKENFNMSNLAKYAKTMAAYVNNCGGYIIFGVRDRPRYLTGLSNDNFENLDQAKFTAGINSLFSPCSRME